MTADFSLPDEVVELRAAVERFARDQLAPRAREAEADGRWPGAVLEALDRFELSSLDLPAGLGGAGGGCLAKVVVLETLAAADAGGLPAADQPGPTAGALSSCPARPSATIVAEAALARRSASTLVVRATDEPEVPPVVEWAPSWPPLGWVWESCGDRLRLFGPGSGIDTGPQALAFGASGTATAALSGWPLAGTWTLPSGGGLAVRGRARLWAAAVTLGIAQAAFDATVTYTTERVVFGRPVAHHQGNAFELAASAAGLHGARLLVHDAARRFDAWGATAPEPPVDAGFWATEAFLETTETAGRVTDLGIQLLGGHGFLLDHLAEKRFREARMLGLLFGGRARAEDDLAGALMAVGGW